MVTRASERREAEIQTTDLDTIIGNCHKLHTEWKVKC
jgi:hypothetical protein